MAGVTWLGVLRHGESVGNIAAQRAERGGAEALEIDTADALTPLSEHGQAQARDSGGWLGGFGIDAIVSSTYLRAVQTATLLSLGPVRTDERLRDRELGILDRLTRHGVAVRYPQEDARRDHVGRFYYRPPGGEAWTDVALRLRSLLADVDRQYDGKRVLLVAHEAVIVLLRYVTEGLTVAEVDALSRHRLSNVGLTSWQRVEGILVMERFDETASATRATRQSDV